jgi:hypothetical protein
LTAPIKIQFPKPLEKEDAKTGRACAKLMEKIGNVSIGDPTTSFNATWQVTNAQCNATVVTTGNNAYLLLERLY